MAGSAGAGIAKDKTKSLQGLNWKKIGSLMLLLSFCFTAISCEISFSVGDKYKKEVYAVGQEIVVDLKVQLTHHHCKVALEDTKISATGCEITGATKWVETTPGVFVRRLKVKVLAGKDNEMKITCQRSCDKDGGLGRISLKKQS